MAAIPLRRMAVGSRGVIGKIRARGELNRRLRDMGLSPGTPIVVFGRAPLNDPVSIKLRGYNLTLRNGEADCIEVMVDE